MKLARRLGVLHVFRIASGAMISSGLFVLPGLAYARAGPAVILSYSLAGLLAATGMLSTAELATSMPKAGSDYYSITRALGPATGTVAGLFNWVSFSLKAAFALVGLAALVQTSCWSGHGTKAASTSDRSRRSPRLHRLPPSVALWDTQE